MCRNRDRRKGLQIQFCDSNVPSLHIAVGGGCSVVSNSFVAPWTIAHQVSLVEFSRQEY